jgi:uncharacterized membrane protein YagU involved in acid resistance
MPKMSKPYWKLLQGAIAGLIAILPMTLFMRSDWKQLPAVEQYGLPPRQITQEVVSPRQFWRMKPGQQTLLTLMFHFLFGAAVGSIFGMVEQKIPMQNILKGSLAGLVIWVGSYLGWIPALGILPPAAEHPWRRNVMMIVAHLIWGMALGVFARGIHSEKPISRFSRRRVIWIQLCNNRSSAGSMLGWGNEAFRSRPG